MGFADDYFEDFEQRFAMYMILMVGEYPGCIKADLCRPEDPKRSTKLARLEYLISKGYIMHPVVNGKETKRLVLTRKGEAAAEALRTL